MDLLHLIKGAFSWAYDAPGRAMNPKSWLPDTRLGSIHWVIRLLVTQLMLLMTPWIWMKIPFFQVMWLNNEPEVTITGILEMTPILISVAFLTAHSIVLAAAIRHLGAIMTSIGDIMGLTIIAVFMSTAAQAISKDELDGFIKAHIHFKIWMGSWGLLTIYALKPLLDAVLDRMYPRQSGIKNDAS